MILCNNCIQYHFYIFYTFFLHHSYESPDIALNCGTMLRESIRQEALAKIILTHTSYFDKFFDYVEMATFDIASDAFATFKVSVRYVGTITVTPSRAKKY